ncbi:MAG TPA: hypothetical protein VJZ91_01065 [Blastocatellia bacterium]|nr:hypothetical protein [Blastocatellia bacterium]
MEHQDTLLLSERAPAPAPASLEDRLRALLELKRDFVERLRGEAALDDEGFAVAACQLMQSVCRLTGADGASLYHSRRQGYLNRQAFCSDPDLAFEQMRATSQITEHVAVGDGIAGFLALDRAARAAHDHQLKYPVCEGAAVEVWDIRLVDDLPEQLRQRTTQLLRDGAIDIASMFLVKSVGADGTDLILQLVRKRANGEFSDQERLVAELSAEMIFPHFRNVETYREQATGTIQLPAGFNAESSAESADAGSPIRQIAADAYEAIKAIASAAIEKIQQPGPPRK